jgi:hypothetical protein
MMESFRQWLARWIWPGAQPAAQQADAPGSTVAAQPADTAATAATADAAERRLVLRTTESSTVTAGHDEHLLERARTQWQFGDWAALARLPADEVQRHPERARLALMLATARAQLGDPQGQRDWALKAKDWGCPPRLMAQVLASGVHNSLGRAAAVAGRQEQAITHFERAIQAGAPGSDMRQLRTARITEQLKQLQSATGLNLGAPALPGEVKAALAPDTGQLNWASMSTLRSLHHMACTGGTLIAKCLAALPGVVVLNEVDPRSLLALEPGAQPRFTPRDMISLMQQSSHLDDVELIDDVFLSDVQVMSRRLAGRGQALLLRDHTHSAYLHGPAVRSGTTLRQTLRRRFTVHSIVTVRNPIDSYLSLLENKWLHFEPATFDEYCQRYLKFLADYEGVKWFRYEDFVARPREVMREMSAALHLPYDESFIEQFPKFKFSGDSGRKGDVIEPRPRREYGEDFVAEVNASSAFKALAYRLGYGEGLEVAAGATDKLESDAVSDSGAVVVA